MNIYEVPTIYQTLEAWLRDKYHTPCPQLACGRWGERWSQFNLVVLDKNSHSVQWEPKPPWGTRNVKAEWASSVLGRVNACLFCPSLPTSNGVNDLPKSHDTNTGLWPLYALRTLVTVWPKHLSTCLFIICFVTSISWAVVTSQAVWEALSPVFSLL